MDNLDAALNRMVDQILSFNEIEFTDSVQYIWRRGWKMNAASRPTDTLLLRIALKACLVERMVDIWNSPPKNCNEITPDWCSEVPALDKEFSVVKNLEHSIWENEECNPIFKKRNIFAPKEFMFFL